MDTPLEMEVNNQQAEIAMKLFIAIGKEEECSESYMFFLVVTLSNSIFTWAMLTAGWSFRAVFLLTALVQGSALIHQALTRRRLAAEVSRVCSEALQLGAILKKEP